MAKYKDGHYLQLTRDIFTEEYKNLSIGAKWLFVLLNELEHRYTKGCEDGRDSFFRSNHDLAADMGVSEPTIKRYKAELQRVGLIKVWQSHYVDMDTGKKSEKRITKYRILK